MASENSPTSAAALSTSTNLHSALLVGRPISDADRAVIYREVAELVLMLPLGCRPQDVAAVLAESADQLEQR